MGLLHCRIVFDRLPVQVAETGCKEPPTKFACAKYARKAKGLISQEEKRKGVLDGKHPLVMCDGTASGDWTTHFPLSHSKKSYKWQIPTYMQGSHGFLQLHQPGLLPRTQPQDYHMNCQIEGDHQAVHASASLPACLSCDTVCHSLNLALSQIPSTHSNRRLLMGFNGSRAFHGKTLH